MTYDLMTIATYEMKRRDGLFTMDGLFVIGTDCFMRVTMISIRISIQFLFENCIYAHH
jgi:hypothetical protein